MSRIFKKVLVIGFVWPEPSSSAAGKRIMQLVSFFIAQNCEITFASTAKKSEFATNLDALGIKSKSIRVNDPGFDDFVAKENPDLVLFDRFMTEEQFGWRVQETCPDALRILDTEDLHSLRYAREKCFKNSDDRIQNYLISDIAKREIASIYRCDLSLIISESELLLLQDFFKVPGEILHYVPYMIDPAAELNHKNWPGFNERQGFMTIGNFRHKPNLDGVNYLRTDIWPLIRELIPDAIMNIYGAYPKQQVKEWHQPSSGFFIHGRTPDANEVMQASRVCLAPLRFGAGLKGKLVEAMINGTPSITTSMGAEGINGSFDWPGEIADAPADFARAAADYYNNEAKWTDAQSRGLEVVKQRFSIKFHYNALRKRLETITKELQHHRTYNFTGAMLMHHTIASTKYMSRWIEQKNRGSEKSG